MEPEPTVQHLGDVLKFKEQGAWLESGGLRNLDTLSYLEVRQAMPPTLSDAIHLS
jgi:hypothetical protein